MMVNLDNQRPGDIWLVGGERLEVVEVQPADEGDPLGRSLVCRRSGGDLVTLCIFGAGLDVVAIPAGSAVVVKGTLTPTTAELMLRRLREVAGHEDFIVVVLAPGNSLDIVTDPSIVSALKSQVGP